MLFVLRRVCLLEFVFVCVRVGLFGQYVRQFVHVYINVCFSWFVSVSSSALVNVFVGDFTCIFI